LAAIRGNLSEKAWHLEQSLASSFSTKYPQLSATKYLVVTRGCSPLLLSAILELVRSLLELEEVPGRFPVVPFNELTKAGSAMVTFAWDVSERDWIFALNL
jgi:hypothetical protein